MATDYRIVGATKELAHSHITNVGTGGTAVSPAETFTTKQVRDKIDNGDTFHTISPSTGARRPLI